jgi:tetratricopeptide (TPR) repeat protein
MNRRLIGTAFVILTLGVGFGIPQEERRGKPSTTAPDTPSPDEERERRVMERFLSVLEKNPRRGTALDRVYGYHVERGTLDKLVESYRLRTKKNPKDGRAWLVLGLIESQRGHDAAAVTALRQADTHLPDDALPAYYLGQSQVLVGQPDDAALAFERALGRKPNRTDLLDIFQALGRVYQQAQRNEQALAVWNRLENLFPDDQRVQEQIATTLAEEGQHEQALTRYEALIKKIKDNYRQTTLRMEAAELKVRLSKSPAALADFEDMLGQLNPESWLFREVRRKIEEVFLRNDDLAGLAKYYEKWIGKNPEDVEAMARLARTLATQGRVPESETWLAKALKLAPSRKELRLALIEQYLADQKIASAVEQYEALNKADPNNPDYIREWGRLILKDKAHPEAERKKEAAKVWRRLLDARPKDPVIVTQVADLFRQAELTDEAIALYQKAIELAPTAAQYREYLGEYYHTLKRPDEAKATWRAIAAGPNRSSKTLARLSEVLSGFGYLPDAINTIAEACDLEADDFTLRLKYADLLYQVEQYPDSLKQLGLAGKLSSNAEEAEAVLQAQIKTYQSADMLTAQIEALQKELRADKDATADRWHRLARYYEAGRQLPEATDAITRALALDKQLIRGWAAAARIHEAGGNLLAAADANRKLAAIDRRYRTEYLTNVAKLESKLGRREPALQAGRDLLAAAPGNPEHYQFYANLCFQLGENEDGFDALRRAVRVNPEEPKVMLTLASSLAERFRTDEAIELYWRAFDKAKELDAKLGVIPRLTELYLQNNHFDRLLERLQRERHEAGKQREMTICLAQAYQAAGDLGTARQQLERLLTENPRDSQLLQQLSSLAETEGDLSAAVKFQQQLLKIAPGKDSQARLAQLLVRSGETEEASAIWVQLIAGEQEPHRVLQAVDSLLAHGKHDTVLAITERLLRDHPRDWEVLYREGAALMGLEKPESAAQRFQALLDLHLPDEELAAQIKAKEKDKKDRPAGTTAATTKGRAYVPPPSIPMQDRITQVWQVRSATHLNPRYYYYSGGPNVWVPNDYGQARMAALGWQLYLAQKQNRESAYLKQRREARAKAGQDFRPAWDLYYLQLLRQNLRDTYEAAKALGKSGDPAGQWAYLTALDNRTAANGPRVVRATAPGAPDKTPPLPAAELDQVVACYRSVRTRRPEWLTPAILSNVTKELRRAKRSGDEEQIYHAALTAANQVETITPILQVAGERGDMDGVFALFDKLEKLQANKTPYGPQPTRQTYTGLAQAMNSRASAKAHGDILRLLDVYLASVRRQNKASPPRPGSSNSSYNNPQGYVQIWIGPNSRYVQLDFPGPNDYHDYGAIVLLRNAYELFKRDDLASDLIKHFQKQLAQAPAADKVYHYLALGYLFWWNNDKDPAMTELTRASEAAPTDLNLRLEVALLRERRGEPDEALALVDGVQPLDHSMMQKREMAAIRLAVRTGSLERARQAADRLFGLRIDAETQVQLATQMQQLGLHDLAEAVLARARRQAGNRTGALVSLMTQYQNQNKLDVAVQVAHQILRRGPSQQYNTPYRNYDENDGARTQALQVLNRSSKLKELVERAETQLKASPKSMQLHQTLADYYKAAGDGTKTKEILHKIGQLKPEDGKLQYQIANQLVEAGDGKAAIPYFKTALKKDPSLFAYNYWQIQQTFQQANQFDELVKLLDDIDLRSLGGNYWSVMQIVQTLLQDEKNQARGLRLFRKAWDAYPDQRQYMLGNFYDERIWKLPEIYTYVHQAMIPVDADVEIQSWSGVDQIINWSGDGKIQSVLSRLMDTANRQSKIEALTRDAEAALKKFPEWSGGKVLMAALYLRRGKSAEARRLVQELLDDKKDPMPTQARWVIAQELENYGSLQDLVLKLHESAVEEALTDINNSNLSYSPAGRLVTLYQRLGRREDARALLMRFAKADVSYPWDYQYSSYQRVQTLMSVGELLLKLGYPVDAARIYNDALSDDERMQAVEQWSGNWMRQNTQQGLERALHGLKADNLAGSLRELLVPRDKIKETDCALDLVILAQARELSQASVTSMMQTAIGSAATKPELFAEVKKRLGDLLKQRSKDLSVQVASVLAVLAEGKAEAIAESATRLAQVIDDLPLEELPAGTRANARQRADAAKQLGLWLVARQCYKQDALRAVSEKLGARALEAARRQLDPGMALAMLREWGQLDLDRNDRAGAERRWSQMLEIVLPRATGSKETVQKAAAAAREGRQLAALPVSNSSTSASDAIAQLAPPAAVPPISNAAGIVPVVTLEQLGNALQLAKFAAEHDMKTLCLRAVRDSLRGGPPIQVMPNNRQSYGRVVYSSVGGRMVMDGGDQGNVPQQVEEKLQDLDQLWKRRHFPAAEVYEVLAGAVLPKSRPAEIFLYPRPLAWGSAQQVRSAGSILATWAVQAGRVDDLRQRIAARQDKPLAELPGKVLLAQVAMANKDFPEATKVLSWLGQRLQKDGVQNTAELACYAALPALYTPDLAKAAIPVLERAAKNLSINGADSAGNLLLALARFHFDHEHVAEARKELAEYQGMLLRTMLRYGGDQYRIQQMQNVAVEYVRAGLLGDALDLFGQYVDSAPLLRNMGVPNSLGVLAASFGRQLALKPAEERYRLMKVWTMPAANRKSVRLLGSFVPEDAPPEVFLKDAPKIRAAYTGGVVSTPTVLIDAARELGKLDELADEVQKAAEQKVENADLLWILIQIARGQGKKVTSRVEPLVAELPKKFPQTEQRYVRYYGANNPSAIQWTDYLVARACLSDADLRGLGEQMARHLLTHAQKLQDQQFMVHLRRDLAAAAAAREGATGRAGQDPGLAMWHPVSHQSAGTHQLGNAPAWWVGHDGIIGHITGPDHDYLYFDYPLTGTFEFSADLCVGGWAEALVSYNGLVYEPFWTGNGGRVWPVGEHETVMRPFPFARGDDFNRITVQVQPGRVRCVANGHVLYEDTDAGATSPWLALLTRRERQTFWRNLTITGKPEIPREVALTNGDRLDGWISSFYGESQPQRRTVPQAASGAKALDLYGVPAAASLSSQENFDWLSRNGEIRGRRSEWIAQVEPIQSRLYYNRPLRSGDTLRYEFFYQPDEVMVHPALDRLTFLLEPDGVRLHWMTDGPDQEWTGLKAGNIVEEPANRRGPAPLPLKSGVWNAVQIALKGATVVVELNGVQIYQRDLERENDRLFGFFHYKDRTSVQVRSVVLKGDWPKGLTGAQLADLTARVPSAKATAEEKIATNETAERRGRHALIGEPYYASNAATVLRKAQAMPAAERYAYLGSWVLPGDIHPLRLYGYYTPTDPAPVVKPQAAKDGNAQRVHTGGMLEAPVLELIATAKELGRLNELADRVLKSTASSNYGQRSRLGFLVLLHIAQAHDAEAAEALKQMLPLLAKEPLDAPIWTRWPELTAASAAMDRPKAHGPALALLDHMVEKQIVPMIIKDVQIPGRGDWEWRVRCARARAQVLGLPAGERKPFGSDPGLAYWSPVTHARADTRGPGMPVAHWAAQNGALIHYPGHANDNLYFNIPLRGDFEVECELTSFGWREARLSYGGLRCGLVYDLKRYELIQFNRYLSANAIEPPIDKVGDWYPFRLVMKDGTFSAFAAGRKLHEERLPPDPDPWLTIYLANTLTGGVRNLKINGTPTIPEVLNLSDKADLSGWLAEYYGETIGVDNAAWQKQGEEIYGLAPNRPDPDQNPAGKAQPGIKQESVLQYHRPLLEDGVIEYEFFYEPGKVLTHPALDRVVFLMEPEGVKIHWLTDAQHDRTGVAPDNVSVEATNRRGGELGLKAREWNRLKLGVVGDRVTVWLNGKEVYQRELEATNQRTFGLFHFADETEVRVRNVTYRGKWPRHMPQGAELSKLLTGGRGAKAKNGE